MNWNSMMSRMALVVMALLLGANAFAQNKQAVKEDLTQYLKANVEFDQEGSLKYTPDELLKQQTADERTAAFDDMKDKLKGLKYEFISLDDLNISKSITYEDDEYTLLDYTYTMKVSIVDPSGEVHGDNLDALAERWSGKYAVEKVVMDYENYALTVYRNGKEVMISKPEYDGIKFVPGRLSIMIVPEEVFMQLSTR